MPPRYEWRLSPAGERLQYMKSLGYGGREKYGGLWDMSQNMLKAPFPIPRRGTCTPDQLEGITSVEAYDLKPYGLKFTVRARVAKWYGHEDYVDVEGFVLQKLGCGLCHLKIFLLKKLSDRERADFKQKFGPLYDKAMKARDVDEKPAPEDLRMTEARLAQNRVQLVVKAKKTPPPSKTKAAAAATAAPSKQAPDSLKMDNSI